MLSNSSQKISLSIARKILLGFEHHYQNIKSASIEAKRCFEEKEWEKIENDSKLRLNFYDEQVEVFCKKLSSELKNKRYTAQKQNSMSLRVWISLTQTFGKTLSMYILN